MVREWDGRNADRRGPESGSHSNGQTQKTDACMPGCVSHSGAPETVKPDTGKMPESSQNVKETEDEHYH